jgi:mannose-1-phosphate guanylyltransferase
VKLWSVILCGGRGERFWPKSRRAQPKQFIRLFGTRTMTQATSDRVRRLCPPSRQILVAPTEFQSIVRAQVPGAVWLFEPLGRNTAPAIGLAAAWLLRRDPDATMVVLPADHLIEDRQGFLASVRLAAELAQAGSLVTFGIKPSRADTGYGYVQFGARVGGRRGLAGFRALRFCEKPDQTTARRHVASGRYLWNSGMFVWRVDAILGAFKKHMPEFHAELQRYARAVGTGKEPAAVARLYRAAPVVSVDYAIMEKAADVVVVSAGFDWDDVGSWLSVARHAMTDSAGNAVNGTLVARDARGCVVETDSGLVALLGVRNLVVVRSGDAVLVAAKDALPAMKQLLADISSRPGARDSL